MTEDKKPNKYANRWANTTPEQRSEFARSGALARAKGMTPKERSAHGKLMAAKKKESNV